MSGKSRRKRGQQKSNIRKVRAVSPVTATQSQTVAGAAAPVTTPRAPTPAPQAKTGAPAPARKVYPHILTELRTIGIMTGIMVIILVILAIALP